MILPCGSNEYRNNIIKDGKEQARRSSVRPSSRRLYPCYCKMDNISRRYEVDAHSLICLHTRAREPMEVGLAGSARKI